MSLTITLNIFSGRPNPVWTLPEEAAMELHDRMEKIENTSNLKPAGVLDGLGYRGFLVRQNEHSPSNIHIHAGVIDPGHTLPSLIADDREIEKWLLSTAPPSIADEVKAHVEEAIASPAPLAAGHGWYVALVVWPGVDYHWYRQDKGGCWSHKPGSAAVRNVDNSGKPIHDPKTCDRGPYKDFCTYMITKSTVHIK